MDGSEFIFKEFLFLGDNDFFHYLKENPFCYKIKSIKTENKRITIIRNEGIRYSLNNKQYKINNIIIQKTFVNYFKSSLLITLPTM